NQNTTYVVSKDCSAAEISGVETSKSHTMVVEINGDIARVIENLAEWMHWSPNDVVQALLGSTLEGWDGDEMETVQACFNGWNRYGNTGRVPDGWHPWLRKEGGK